MSRNMNIKLTTVTALALVLSTSVNAAIIDRGMGLLYDDYFDITWISDGYYPSTSGYLDNTNTINNNGRLTWQEATDWVNQLEYKGFTDWRLPTLVDLADPGCDYTNNNTDCGFNSNTDTSEMAHLYYEDLGNIGSFDIYGNPQSGYGALNAGLFTNIQNCFYWTDQTLATNSEMGWFFNVCDGSQDTNNKNYSFFAFAVHDGDIAVSAVPIPSVVWLFGSGFIGLVGVARRKKA